MNDSAIRAGKGDAVCRQQAMSELVKVAQHTIDTLQVPVADLPPLPKFRGGGSRVNVANRNELDRAMEQ